MIADLERFGQLMYHPGEERWRWSSSFHEFVLPMVERYKADPDGFLTALADLAEEHGGWVAYGAERIMMEVSDNGNPKHPAYKRIMEASLRFLRSSGVPPMCATTYEWTYWEVSLGGDKETWVPRRPTPALSEAPITELGAGEVRRVARFTESPDSNVGLVEHGQANGYDYVVDARQSSNDPTRSRQVHQTADSLYEIYVQIGLRLQMPPYWYDGELEPYFPFPTPSI
ncbi:MAG: hypothetical protein ACRDNF_16650 [Streptosporangiaceae bacterium]